MIEPSPDALPSAEPLTDAEREARIEQLLVSGLEEYFAGRLDHAVNVWTRVLFLDRTNDRARAYIDRARRALAERQRESEALMHQGLQAFDDGDVDRARTLLTRAVEHGAPHEQALPVLHRIGLLDVAPTPSTRGRRTRTDRATPTATGSRSGPWVVVGLVIAAAAGVLYVAAQSAPPPPGAITASALERVAAPLPVPGAMEAHLVRARQLFDAGKLPDALAVLDRIDPGDGAWPAAQVLRGRVQQELLRAAEPSREDAR
jgi:tetratricopeptide (TPR) repeat protein